MFALCSKSSRKSILGNIVKPGLKCSVSESRVCDELMFFVLSHVAWRTMCPCLCPNPHRGRDTSFDRTSRRASIWSRTHGAITLNLLSARRQTRLAMIASYARFRIRIESVSVDQLGRKQNDGSWSPRTENRSVGSRPNYGRTAFDPITSEVVLTVSNSSLANLIRVRRYS